MEIVGKKVTQIIMTLTAEEALWLQGYMQNSLPDEDAKTSFMREQFFEHLYSALQNPFDEEDFT